MGIATWWQAPEVNPVNKKARSIPFFNPIDVYGRVFHFSWFGCKSRRSTVFSLVVFEIYPTTVLYITTDC